MYSFSLECRFKYFPSVYNAYCSIILTVGCYEVFPNLDNNLSQIIVRFAFYHSCNHKNVVNVRNAIQQIIEWFNNIHRCPDTTNNIFKTDAEKHKKPSATTTANPYVYISPPFKIPKFTENAKATATCTIEACADTTDTRCDVSVLIYYLRRV